MRKQPRSLFLIVSLYILLFSSCSFLALGVPPRRMPSGLGQNLWNVAWGNNWHDYYKEGLDWATVKNPWRTDFLKDIDYFKGPIRFMDWDVANFNPIVNWADRAPKTHDHYDLSYNSDWEIPIDVDKDGTDIRQYYSEEAGDYSYTFWGVAYEWMIDLCNRTGRDMWICVPIFASDDYCRNLAELINSTLDRNLKVYLEYANETWNPGFKSLLYHKDKALAMNLPGSAESDYHAASAYSVYRSLQVFQIFQDVFGEKNTGIDRRLVRCLCAMGNEDFCTKAIRNIMYDGTIADDYSNVPFNGIYNPNGQRPDVFGMAPYVGGDVDGASSSAILQFRKSLDAMVDYINFYKKIVVDRYDFPLVAYEGGQHVLTNADTFSSNHMIYDEYLDYLDTWKDMGFIMFVHYTLYGAWTSGGAWGSKENVHSALSESYKFRALVDWQAMNP